MRPEYIPRRPGVQGHWRTIEPDYDDIVSLFRRVGERAFYTLTFTGIPDKDSPKTGYSREWHPGEVAVFSLVFTREDVQIALEEMDEYLEEYGDEGDIGEIFASSLSQIYGINWLELHELSINDPRPEEE